jgi:hypothetical protein
MIAMAGLQFVFNLFDITVSENLLTVFNASRTIFIPNAGNYKFMCLLVIRYMHVMW